MAALLPGVVKAIALVGGKVGLGKAASFAIAKGIVDGVALVALNVATSLLTPSVGTAGSPTEWRADPDAPLYFPIGRGGTAGQIVHRDEYGPDNMYQSIVGVIGAGGPIKAFAAWTFDDQAVTFNPTTGAATSSQWVNEMWVTTRLGAQPDTALTSPSGLKNGASLPGWGASNKLSGKASYMLTMAENSKRTAYPTGEPKPLITWEGCYGWDPRLDSTYPGGSGSCRLSDPSTWVWIDNPALGALKWALGFWEGASTGGGYGVPQACFQVGGFGSKVEGIDVAAFVDAANIADVNGWTVAAYPSSADDKAQVMDALLQACGAIYAERAGKVSCIQRAAPRTSVVTISAADTAGPLELDTSVSRIGRINTIRPRFWSEANRWQMTAAEEVTATSYQTEDGGKRTRGVDFPYVRSVQQASELAALQIAHTRESFRGVIPLKPHLQRIRPGDAFTITEPGFLLDGQKCLCLDTEFDAATGVHRVTFVSETDAKYPFAYGQSPDAPEPATLSPNPGPPAPPDIADWTITPRPPTTGGNLPGLDITGGVENAAAFRVLVEYGPTDAGPWTQAYEGPPTTDDLNVTVPNGGTYYVAITYFDRAGVASSRTVFGPYTAPGLVAGDTVNVGGEPAENLLAGLAAASSDAAAALSEIAAEVLRATTSESAITASLAALDGEVSANYTALVDADAGLAALISSTQSQLDGFEASAGSTLAALALADGALASRTDAIEARANMLPNLLENSGFTDGFRGWTNTANWSVESSTAVGSLALTTAAGTQFIYSDFKVAQPGQVFGLAMVGDGGSGAANNDSYGFIEIWATDDGVPTEKAQEICPVALGDRDWSTVKRSAVETNSSGGLAWRFGFRKANTDVAAFSRVMVCAGPPPLTWSDQATDRSLAARVALTELAAVDFATQKAIAAWAVLAEATGGAPARIGVVSTNYGPSGVVLDANVIGLGDNTYFDNPLDAWVTTFGSMKRVRAEGAGLGPEGDVEIWVGPASVALADISKTNGSRVETTDGRVYRNGALQRPTRRDFASVTASPVYMTNILAPELTPPPGPAPGNPSQLAGTSARVATIMVPFVPAANDIVSVGLHIAATGSTRWVNPTQTNTELWGGDYEICAWNGSTPVRIVGKGTWRALNAVTGSVPTPSPGPYPVRSVGINKTRQETEVLVVLNEDGSLEQSITGGNFDRFAVRMSTQVGGFTTHFNGEGNPETYSPSSYLENLVVGLNISTSLAP